MNQSQVKNSLYNSLKELGLSDSETNLYTASLALGPSPIKKIAEQMGISRPNVYKVISGLEKHGLAKPYDKVKYSRKFIVEPPTAVLEMIRKKKAEMARLDMEIVSGLPELISSYNQGAAPTKIKIIQGKEQFLKVYTGIPDEAKKEIQYLGAAADFIDFISWKEEKKWIAKRMKKNIFIKILIFPGETADIMVASDEKEKRETRILKGVWPFVTSYLLFANKVFIWQPKTPLVVLIEDQYIVEMLKSLFDFMWEKSKN